jgi:hypothetical protein
MLAIERKAKTDYQLDVRAKKIKLLILVFSLQLVITATLWTATAAAFPQEKPMSLSLQYGFLALLYAVPFLAYMRVLYDVFPSRISAIGRMIILCAISLLLAWFGMFAGTTIWFVFF